VGSCEHGNEYQGYIKDVKFLEQLRHSQLFKRDSAPYR
jgi:hypothetical protein